jgi:pilus assembly protein CpaB
LKKLVIISLILAAITGFLVYNYATNIEKQYEYPTKPVVVAKAQIQQHTIITSDMLEVVSLPEQAVHSMSSDYVGMIIGKIAAQTIESGEQILSSKIGELSDKSADLSYSIDIDQRALTIKTDEISGVAGEIKKGDRIDIVSIMLTQVDGENVIKAFMIAENIEVIRVGSSKDPEAVSNTSVTVSIPAQDILKVSYALSEGKCRLVLRSIIDTQLLDPAPFQMK